MQQLETKLTELFTTKAPFQLPENAKKTLVKFVPWVTLLGGILSILALIGVFQLISLGTGVVNYTNELSRTYGYAPAVSPIYVPGLWLSMAVLGIEAILFLVAFSPLKSQQKKGWNLLFYIAVANMFYSLLYLIVDMNIASLIFSWIGSIIGLYFLFQIRSYYLGSAKATTSTTPKNPVSPTTPSSTPPAAK